MALKPTDFTIDIKMKRNQNLFSKNDDCPNNGECSTGLSHPYGPRQKVVSRAGLYLGGRVLAWHPVQGPCNPGSAKDGKGENLRK